MSEPGVKTPAERTGVEVDAASLDAELVQRCQQGDLTAFEALMDRYQDRVFNLVYRLAGHYQDAQDIAQDVFVRALEHIGEFRQQARFYTWLFRIAVNVAISRRRRTQRVRFVSLDGSPGNNSDDEPGEAGSNRLPDTRSPAPDQAADSRERVECVTEAIGRLEEEFRSVLVLKDIEGFDYQQISEVLELPLGTVKSRLHRARVELKEHLGPMLEQ